MEAFFAEATANHSDVTMDICNIEGVKDEQTIMVYACKFAAHYNCSNV